MRKLMILILLSTPLFAAQQNSFSIEVLVNGVPTPEYFARGTTYIEAFKGREYEVRLTNPFPFRVAVALAVDGLNSIDARHTDARAARKWVLDPYQTITINGWQTNDQQARRFFFTSEEQSYGNWLGRTQNLGIVSAAFFRERARAPITYYERRDRESKDGPRAQAAPAAPEPQANLSQGLDARRPSKAEEYAATGIGQAVSHPVTRVQMDLEDSPAAVITLRYEFRPALIALGVFPRPQTDLQRRERSRGFQDTGYCPTPR